MSEYFDRLMRALDEALAFLRGEDVPGMRVHIPDEINTVLIRQKTGMSAADMADYLDVTPERLADFDAGRRVPAGEQREKLSQLLSTDES